MPSLPKSPADNTFTLGDEPDAIFVGDLAAIDRLAAAVPDAEDDPPLRGTVDLHAEVAAMPAAGHVVRRDRVFQTRSSRSERRNLGVFIHRVHQMHRGGVAAGLEIEVRILRSPGHRE